MTFVGPLVRMQAVAKDLGMTDDAVHVRKGQLADLEVVVAFNREMARLTEGRVLAADTLRQGVAAALRDPDRGRYLLAEVDGEVVGQLMLTREWSDWRNGWFWWIQSVFVAAAARRRGVFRALWEHVCAEAAAAGDVCGLRLYVEGDNETAQAVYRSMGMVRTGYQLWEREGLSPGAGAATDG